MYGNKPVSKQAIFEKLNSYDIFKKYVSNFQEVGRKFKSDLRDDKNPTCCITRIGDDLRYRDFTEMRSIDCIDYIQRKYSVTYLQALEIINLDFNLGLTSNVPITYTPTPSQIHNIDILQIPKQEVVISVILRDFNIYDKRFWKDRYNISSKTLTKFNIFPISGFWFNNVYVQAEPVAYAYYFGKHADGRDLFKIYQPFSRNLKWLSNCPQEFLQGYDQLPEEGDILIITKSLKDVVVLTNIGYNAIAPHSEHMFLPADILSDLKERFNNILFLYDNDVPGFEAVTKLSDLYNIPYFMLPSDTKDASDFVQKYSDDELKLYIDEQLISCNNT